MMTIRMHEQGASAEQVAPFAATERERRILLWMPWEHDADTLVRVLRQEGVPGHACPRFEDLTEKAGRGAGTLLLSDDVLQPDTASQLRRLLDEQPPWSDLPVVILCDGRSMARTAALAQDVFRGAPPALGRGPCRESVWRCRRRARRAFRGVTKFRREQHLIATGTGRA